MAGEIRHIQRRAAAYDGRLVKVGPLLLFSTDTGDAWLLDPADRLAARLAQNGDPVDVYFEDSQDRFAIGWKGNYRIDGDANIFIDRETGGISAIIGYPTQRLAKLGSKSSNMSG